MTRVNFEKVNELREVHDILTRMIKAMAKRPQEVVIETLREGDISVFQVRASKTDLGSLIGRNGQTARAVRSLLISMAAKTRQKVALSIIADGHPEQRAPFRYS